MYYYASDSMIGRHARRECSSIDSPHNQSGYQPISAVKWFVNVSELPPWETEPRSRFDAGSRAVQGICNTTSNDYVACGTCGQPGDHYPLIEDIPLMYEYNAEIMGPT